MGSIKSNPSHLQNLTLQESVQRIFADAVSVADLLGLQIACRNRGDHILFRNTQVLRCFGGGHYCGRRSRWRAACWRLGLLRGRGRSSSAGWRHTREGAAQHVANTNTSANTSSQARPTAWVLRSIPERISSLKLGVGRSYPAYPSGGVLPQICWRASGSRYKMICSTRPSARKSSCAFARTPAPISSVNPMNSTTLGFALSRPANPAT